MFCGNTKNKMKNEGQAMIKRIGEGTIEFDEDVIIESSVGVAGKDEKQGPLGEYFDITFDDDRLGQETWEKSESALQTTAVQALLKKTGISAKNIDIIFAGDLLNQCISSTFGLRDLKIPMYGQYGACSTMAQTISVASVFIASGAADRAIAVTSSHFCSAERQFRLPIEYGGQKTPTSQRTVTGSGAALITRGCSGTKIKHITAGRINDLNIKDANNMGAAMAPAAADTIKRFFTDTNTRPSDYDLILTGDLGKVGSKLLKELMEGEGCDISGQHNDCGCMIFDPSVQDVHAGGSGCGCCGSVFCSYIMQKLSKHELNNILFIATGALMSPTSSQQGESIPSIAHLVHLVNG